MQAAADKSRDLTAGPSGMAQPSGDY
jgi:hypothetical protein